MFLLLMIAQSPTDLLHEFLSGSARNDASGFTIKTLPQKQLQYFLEEIQKDSAERVAAVFAEGQTKSRVNRRTGLLRHADRLKFKKDKKNFQK